MKLKIMAAALALLMLLSACSRNKSNYKYNIPGYTGNTEYSAAEEEQSGYVEYAYDEDGRLICLRICAASETIWRYLQTIGFEKHGLANEKMKAKRTQRLPLLFLKKFCKNHFRTLTNAPPSYIMIRLSGCGTVW